MLDFRILDVFTDRPFSGNPLAVVFGADGLDGRQMQAIARQFNLSETIFLLTPDAKGQTARVRIFLPRTEIPFAGHPVLGAAMAVSGGSDGVVVLGTAAGLVTVTLSGGVGAFDAPVLPRAGAAIDAAVAAAALGLDPARVGAPDGTAPGHAVAASTFACVPVADAATLAAASPVPGAAWDALTAQTPLVYLHTPAPDGQRVRLFAPGAGLPEDPATGAAAAALPARLLAAGALAEGTTAMTLRQGAEVDRPSRIGLTVSVRGGALERVTVSGRAVPVADGRIAIPPA